MNQSITNLSEKVERNTRSVDERLVSLGSERCRAVDEVGAHETRDSPVEEAVLEDVPEGHGVGGELVDKERLDLALDKVQDDQGKGQPLGGGHGLVSILVEIGTGGDDGDVEKDGSEVLDNEDGLPSNLRACIYMLQRLMEKYMDMGLTKILYEDFARRDNSWLINDTSLAVLESLLGRGIKQSNTVVVADPGNLCYQDLEVVDGSISIELDRGG